MIDRFCMFSFYNNRFVCKSSIIFIKPFPLGLNGALYATFLII